MGDLIDNTRINRRQFFKIVGFSTGALALAPFLSASKPVGEARAARHNHYYRGTQDGKVLGSRDGKNWSVITNFGPHLKVSEVVVTRDAWVRATLVIGGSSFVLKSRDEKTWYTPDFTAPGFD